MCEADEIVVLDTGSSDDTVVKLQEKGVIVSSRTITPWRFDVARNLSLELVPEDVDICVCTDLDEVFEPGWRHKLEQVWDKDTTRVKYNYNWSFNEDGTPAVNYYLDKIHARKNYIWKHPVHEVITFIGENENVKYTDEVTLNHYPDRSKSRGSYLPLLELSVLEDPLDDRNMHYLGREYMYYERWNDCIDTLIKHLSLKSATWKAERSASMRFIGRSYIALNRFNEAEMWFNKAIDETPNLREPYMEMAFLKYRLEDWEALIYYLNKMFEIDTHDKIYINEPCCYNEIPYELLAISYFYQNKIDDALKYINKAIEINDKNERLFKNKEIILNAKTNN